MTTLMATPRPWDYSPWDYPASRPAAEPHAAFGRHGPAPTRRGWVQPGRLVVEHPQQQEESSVPPLCAAIARVAVEQFRRWRPGGGRPLLETSAAASPILREYYQVGVGQAVTDAQMRSGAYQASHPWSAAFVSYVMRTAGAASFPFSAAHRVYIRAARRNRLERNTANPFWAYRATEVPPQVGDLVCASRGTGPIATYDTIAEPRNWQTHCDVVTEVRPGSIRVIGGNVGQTVGEKWLRTLPDGRLSLTGPQSRFFAVIRCQAGEPASELEQPAWPGPAARRPVRSGPAAGRPAPGDAGLEARVARVMNLLVNQHGYPVNGAAGLVGNLMAESGVLPNRIEGSRPETPMRAPDFTGRVRVFSADEVRDRSFARRTGPLKPGIGIAQWTFAPRRAGLFRHSFRGQQLGSAILTNLEAQVDYLVIELRTKFQRVDKVLRSPGVSVEQASDVTLLQFESPADRSQKKLAERRGLAARALRIHQAARRS